MDKQTLKTLAKRKGMSLTDFDNLYKGKVATGNPITDFYRNWSTNDFEKKNA